MLLYVFVFVIIIPMVLAIPHCENKQHFLRYYKIKSCHRSTLPVIGFKNYATVLECMKFARERRALALNYSPPEVRNLSNTFILNCQVLGCPEFGKSPTLVLDAYFDYYTAYGAINSTDSNATCIKSIGVFQVSQNITNYTNAVLNCQNMGGDLANIVTDLRTNQLASLLNATLSNWLKAAYVGLYNIENNIFKSTNGISLSCSTFRAWSPGHPRSRNKHEKCVILDTDKTWRVVNCRLKLASICELYPSAPPKLIQEFSFKDCDAILDERKKRRCFKEKRIFTKLFNNSTRMDKCALL